MTTLNDGRPVFVETDTERIGSGPWARWLATAIVPDESSPRAERGRVLARTGHVHTVSIAKGEITARVIGSSGTEYAVGLAADPVAPRIWAAIIGSPRARTLFEPAAAGREQSLQLEHVMTVDWDEPLVPPGKSIRRSCTCPDHERSGTCKHVIALGYVVADAIDQNPADPARMARLHRAGAGGRGAGRAPPARRRCVDFGTAPGNRRAAPAAGRVRVEAPRCERARRRRRRSP